MPKEVFHITQFHGGINDANVPTDIADHECEIADSCSLSTVGKIATAGDLKGTTSDGDIPSQETIVSPGKGLFAFTHDFNMYGYDPTSNSFQTSSSDEVPTQFLCISDGSKSIISC